MNIINICIHGSTISSYHISSSDIGLDVHFLVYTYIEYPVYSFYIIAHVKYSTETYIYVHCIMYSVHCVMYSVQSIS